MTTMPSQTALRAEDAGLASSVPTPEADPAAFYAYDEPCTVLLGWQRREGVLRMLSAARAVVGGVTGLRPGDRVRLVLHGGQAVIRDCRVVGTSLLGVELERAERDGFLA